MSDSLFLNGNRIDLSGKPITRKLQVGDIAEIEKIKSSFSYTFNIPTTSNNLQVLDMLGVIGNTSRKPYESILADYVEDNIYLIRNGFALIKSKGKGFQLNIIDGFKNIEDLLGDSKINDLDFSSYDHNITLTSYTDSLDNTEGYIYAIADFGQGTNTSIESIFTFLQSGIAIGDNSVPFVVFSQPEGAGGRDVVNSGGTSTKSNSFFVVQEGAISLEVTVPDLQISGTFLADGSSVKLLLKQYRGVLLHSSTTIVTEIGDDTETFFMDESINQIFTDIQEGDYFIVSMEANSGSFESEVENTGFTNVVVESILKIEKQAPSFFLHTLLSMILDQNNIEAETDLFSDVEFKKELITISNGYLVTSIGQAVSFSGLFGEIMQIAIIKDIAFRYGLILMLRDGKLHLVEIDKIVTGQFGFVDWTSKFKRITSENYTLPNYAKNNYIKYVYPEGSTESMNGNLVVNNESLTLERDLYISMFEIADFSEALQGVSVYSVPIREVDEDSGEVEVTETPIKLFKIDENDVIITVKLLDDASETDLTTDVPFLSLINVSMQYYINNYYDDFNGVIDDYKELEVELNLNTIDIYNLDFSKLVYLKQTGRFAYINSIQYTKGRISKVKITEV